MENKEFISTGEDLFEVDYAALGQEVYTGEEEQGMEQYSPKEMARLWSFEHIIRQANEVEERLTNNEPQEMWWVVKDKEGKEESKTLLWRETWHMVGTMRNTAFNMYTGHDVETPEGLVHVDGFIDDPKMKEAADQLCNQIREEKAQAKEFEGEELARLWDSS